MTMEHPNTFELMRIEYEAIKRGWAKKYPNKDFCLEVAQEANEVGNDFPSNEALEIARAKLNQLLKES